MPEERSASGDGGFSPKIRRRATSFVRHEANVPSGGRVLDVEMGTFLGRAACKS
jgi:hypothetical protein